MIYGEDGQIQCNKCRSIDIKSKIYLEDGKAWELFTCNKCGKIYRENIPLQREDKGEK